MESDCHWKETLALGAAYGLVATCFQYPGAAWFDGLRQPGHWRAWPKRLPAGDSALAETLGDLRNRVRHGTRGDLDDITTRYASLFGHTVRGSCPPYELEYGADEILQRASELADIAGFYGAFGLEITGDGLERPDHISAECEFLAALCSKAAYAMQSADAEGAGICEQARRRFLRDHSGRWLPAFTQRLIRADTGFYGLAAGFAAALVESDCRRLGVPCGSPFLQLRPVDPDRESEQTCGKEPCGSADALIPLSIGRT